jgi:glycosyltransferase involved in cell wall biosynthesis
MRIAQVSPLAESVPPRLYGGTERIVSYLTEELVAQDHTVTLFASGDSQTAAELVSPCRRALRLDADCHDRLAYHILQTEQVAARARDFDLIHCHVDYIHFPVLRRMGIPCVTTLHGRLDLRDLIPVFREFADMPLVSISDAQRQPLSWANWAGTVYHGLPEGSYRFNPSPGDYLAFLGRISPEKRVDLAIEIARQARMPIRIAAKIDPTDGHYFREVVAPLLKLPHVDFLGEIAEADKSEFLGNARAVLFPIDWPEPFGLVMIESMACGTPVVAFRRGSVPEVMENGVTGWIVDDVDGAVEAVHRVASVDRGTCRRVFERRFSAGRMAADYLTVYEKLQEAHGPDTIIRTGASR